MLKSGLAIALTLYGMTATAQIWPEYVCHPAEEGKGIVHLSDLQERIGKTQGLPAKEAIAALQKLTNKVRVKDFDHALIARELAWRYFELGDTGNARLSAFEVVNSKFMTGKVIDNMRALAAQTYVDEGNWAAGAQVIEALVENECRPVPAQVRLLLATADIRLHHYDRALLQIDKSHPKDDEKGWPWIKEAMALDCRSDDALACAARVLTYASWPAPSKQLQAMVNQQLHQLAGRPEARAELDQARTRGLLDDRMQLIPRPAEEVFNLVPLVRIAPRYPNAALRAGQSGYVTLAIEVGVDGSVKNARVLDSVPVGVFDEAALTAAVKGLFRPKIVDGKAVEAEGIYTVHFTMER